VRLIKQSELLEEGPLVLRPDHEIRFTPEQQKRVDALLARFAASPFSPPTIKDCLAEVGEDVYQALVDLEQLLPVSPEVVFRWEDYQAAVDAVRKFIEKNGSITVAQARDHWGTSRRYVLALLEFMDSQWVTVRDGDTRKLKK
jgi:selenocysteine-specific elongation factor